MRFNPIVRLTDTKNIGNWIALSLFLVTNTTCYSPSEFPVEPSIAFESIEYKEIPNTLDSLILTIHFQDGDGDLGLDPTETGIPYNAFTFKAKNPNAPLEQREPITYSLHLQPPWDTLPPYEWPYYCTNYITDFNFPGYEGDTLYFEANEDHWNIIVQFFIKKNGIWTEFDWIRAFPGKCVDSFNGRFPLLGDDDPDTPMEGTLRYGMISSGFKLIFRQDTVKLRIKIKDRALHNSNIVESPGFVLRDIQSDADI